MFGLELTAIFANLPPELAVFLIAMLPISELRGAIPAGIGVWHLSWPLTALLAISGNVIPAIFILLFIDPVTRFLRQRSKFFEKFISWLFARTRQKFYSKHEKWGNLALVIFIAIPLPATGAWTGALAAFLFGIKFTKALPLVIYGVIIAAAVVTVLTLGVVSIF